MQVKKIVEQAIMDSMTPEQEKAVLDSITNTVKQAKAIHENMVESSADLIVKGLKQIEAKLVAKIDVEASKIKQPVDGKDGKDGKQGKDGAQGPKGADGRDGRDGKDGKDGVDGLDGVSVVNAFLDFDNSLVIELSTGRQINVGGALSDATADKVRVVANGGGTSQGVLDAIAALQAEIDAISPTLVITDTFVVGSEAAMLALSTAEKGDVAVRTDINKTFILKADPYSTLSNWQELLTPTDLVISVAGRTGAITLSYSDISGLGTAATTNSTAYATAAQGAKADTALQSFTETDPVYVASSWYGTTNNSTNWNTAYGWGNHASAGYLTTSVAASTYAPLTGTGASGTWGISISGNAATATSATTAGSATTATSATSATNATNAANLVTTNFSIVESGGKLLIKYGSTTIASISSTGVITSAVNIISNGTP